MCWILERRGCSSSKRCCPDSLSLSARVCLSKSEQPSRLSSVRTCLLAALCVMHSSCAALVKLPSRATDSKHVSVSRGGSVARRRALKLLIQLRPFEVETSNLTCLASTHCFEPRRLTGLTRRTDTLTVASGQVSVAMTQESPNNAASPIVRTRTFSPIFVNRLANGRDAHGRGSAPAMAPESVRYLFLAGLHQSINSLVTAFCRRYAQFTRQVPSRRAFQPGPAI